MIHHIFKIIWNERKSNILIFLEFILVFCVFWFCCDYLYYIASRYSESAGYDINHVYMVSMDKDYSVEEDKDEAYSNANILKRRLENYPGVEAVCFSISSIPYGGSTTSSGFYVNNDSTNYGAYVRMVTPEYFDLFRIELQHGRIFNEAETTGEERVCLISGDRYGYFSDDDDPGFPVEEIRTLKYGLDAPEYKVVGIVDKQKMSTFSAYESAIYQPMLRSRYSCDNEIAVRIRPEADKEFIENFTRDMSQFVIGPYTFHSIASLRERQEASVEYAIGDNLKSILSVSAFLVINIFLGIIGTFWSRIESRKGEIGLRLALGSTKGKVQWQMFTETMILLLIASIIGFYISVNLSESEMLNALGIPMADYNQAGFGSGHYIMNYLLTFILLAIISGLAVWYPSRLASRYNPADTLRME